MIMAVENFAVLPASKQREVAVQLLNTINTNNIFSGDTNFEIVSVEADDVTGGLVIAVSLANPMPVARSASWTCALHRQTYTRRT